MVNRGARWRLLARLTWVQRVSTIELRTRRFSVCCSAARVRRKVRFFLPYRIDKPLSPGQAVREASGDAPTELTTATISKGLGRAMGRRERSPAHTTSSDNGHYPKTRPFAATFRWRDPDSNRGHHDFQACAPATERRESAADERPICRDFPGPPFPSLRGWRVEIPPVARGCGRVLDNG
jgi:hypothetical protein